MERVSVIHGKNPVLLVAPHGFDDSYTDVMTEAAAKTCKGNAVINRAWERHPTVDVLKDKANCNNWKHVNHDVVKDEFLDPITAMETRFLRQQGVNKLYVFHIHGCGNDIRKKTGENLSVVIGYGEAEPGKRRLTCDKKTRDLFTWLMEQDKMWLPAQAGPGSKFAGWDTNNLLQMWKSSVPMVAALQLEFVTATRRTQADAETSGNYLGALINTLLAADGTSLAPPATYAYLRINV